MQANHVVATGIIGTGKNASTENLRIALQLNDGSSLIVEFDRGIVDGIELALRSYLSTISHPDAGGLIAAQALSLNSCQPFSVADGRVGLVLEIEQMKLSVVFPIEAIPAVLESLTRMHQLAQAIPAKKTN
jgi:hypothetical protein